MDLAQSPFVPQAPIGCWQSYSNENFKTSADKLGRTDKLQLAKILGKQGWAEISLFREVRYGRVG